MSLIYQLKIVKDFEKPIYLTDFGQYNTFPNPWRPTHEHEFIHTHAIWIPKHVEYRQISMPDLNFHFKPCHIHYWHHMAIAVVFPQKWRCGDKKHNEWNIVYEEPVLYFKIGCEHEIKELSVDECYKRGIKHFGHCWHVEECTKCGYLNEYDSSG